MLADVGCSPLPPYGLGFTAACYKSEYSEMELKLGQPGAIERYALIDSPELALYAVWDTFPPLSQADHSALSSRPTEVNLFN